MDITVFLFNKKRKIFWQHVPRVGSAESEPLDIQGGLQHNNC